jgi:hypothetical protein
MKILKIDGASSDDERAALREVLAIWEGDGACSENLRDRLPKGRVEVNVASNVNDQQLNGIVGFHPLDERGPTITH